MVELIVRGFCSIHAADTLTYDPGDGPDAG